MTKTVTALDLASQVHAALTLLAGISDRLGLAPVSVTITAATYSRSGRVAVQFGTDDRASVDRLADEIGAAAVHDHGPLYDRKGPDADGVEWGAFCGLTVDDDDTAAVTA